MIRTTKIYLICLLVGLYSCQSNQNKTESKLPKIVATTGMIKDAVVNIMGDLVEVEALMGPGVDPHLYQATPGDLAKMNKADVIIYNGLYLEGKLNDILKKLANKKSVINFSDAIDKTKLSDVTKPQFEGEIYDPHIWFSISIWSQGIKGLSLKLGEIFPQHKDAIGLNTLAYLSELATLEMELVNQMDSVPIEDRILVTSHDAFHYFGEMLNIQVEALQGISTASEFGLQDRKQLVDLIVEKKVKAVFIESSVGDKPLKAVISDCKNKGHDVVLGGTLFSDAMGQKGTPEGTYMGMLRHNVTTVVESLKSKK